MELKPAADELLTPKSSYHSLFHTKCSTLKNKFIQEDHKTQSLRPTH